MRPLTLVSSLSLKISLSSRLLIDFKKHGFNNSTAVSRSLRGQNCIGLCSSRHNKDTDFKNSCLKIFQIHSATDFVITIYCTSGMHVNSEGKIATSITDIAEYDQFSW